MRDDVSPQVKQIARRLMAYEAKTATPARVGDHTSPAFRICEKLRHPLSRLAGVAGFRSLLSRALALASEEVRWLKTIRIATNGSLEGFKEGLNDTQAQLSQQQIDQGEIVLVAQLLGLLMTFIGEGLTMQLLQQEWPKVALDDRTV